VSISPNACVIIDDKPHFLTVNEILKINTDKTVALLTQELEIRRSSLLEKILFSSLEKIFIENRIYRDIEECETWEEVLTAIDKGLEPYKKQFYREITEEDLVRLTEIKIKRISRFDSFKAEEALKKLEEDLKETEYHLAHIIEYAVDYFKGLLERYGKGRERKTEIKSFETISAKVVAANNAKLYVNRSEGFIGYGLKKDEFVMECSDLDDVMVIRKDGVCKVSRISDKVFMGKGILYAGVFKKNDERLVFNMIYLDGKSGRSMAKRFQVLAITRDKEYQLTKGHKGSKALYLSANPNAEAEVVTVYLTSGSKARKKVFDFDFVDLDIKGRSAGGNIVTRYPVRKVVLSKEGVSTMGGLDIWYDPIVGRLNRDQRGNYVGKFQGNDRIMVVYKDGSYELTDFELTNRYEPEKVVMLDQYASDKVVSAVHYDSASKSYYLKRFCIETSTVGKRFIFINESQGSKLLAATSLQEPTLKIQFKREKSRKTEEAEFVSNDLIEVKGWKATGNKFTKHRVVSAAFLGPDGVEEVAKPPQSSTPPAPQPAKDTDVKSAEEPDKPSKKVASKQSQKPKSKAKDQGEASDKGDGYQVGTTIDLDVSSDGEQDQLGLFES